MSREQLSCLNVGIWCHFSCIYADHHMELAGMMQHLQQTCILLQQQQLLTRQGYL